MSFNTNTLDVYARENGWEVKVDSPYSWWSRIYTKGQARILVRTKGDNHAYGTDRVTDVAINDGSGVVYQPKKDKKSEVLSALELIDEQTTTVPNIKV